MYGAALAIFVLGSFLHPTLGVVGCAVFWIVASVFYRLRTGRWPN